MRCLALNFLVPGTGLEPVRPAALDPDPIQPIFQMVGIVTILVNAAIPIRNAFQFPHHGRSRIVTQFSVPGFIQTRPLPWKALAIIRTHSLAETRFEALSHISNLV
jgi:hypothetical protein